MDAYSIEISESTEYDDFMPYPAEPLRPSMPFIVASTLFGLTAALAYFLDQTIAAALVFGIWVFIVATISPRVGVVIALTIQVWDVVFNPEIGGAFVWISPGRVLTAWCIVAYLRYLLWRRPNITSVKKSIIMFFVFVLWALVSVIWADYKLRGLWVVTKIFLQVPLLIVAVDLLSGRKVLEQTFILIIIGSVTGGIYSMVGGIAVRAESDVRMELAGALVNELSHSLGTAIMVGFALLILRKSIMAAILAFVGGAAMFLVTLRAGTRGMILYIPASIFFGLLIAYWRQAHKIIFVGITGTLIFAFSMYWAVQSGFISGWLQERMLGTFGTDWIKNNLRLQLWQEAIGIAMRHPLGVGAGGERAVYIAEGTAKTFYAHNIFLSILIEYNIIGLGIFLAALMFLVRGLLRIRDPALRCGAGMILCFCLLVGMKMTAHESRLFWQPIMLTMMMIETDYRERQMEIQEGLNYEQTADIDEQEVYQA